MSRDLHDIIVTVSVLSLFDYDLTLNVGPAF
jgi:preprotein translocase subunit SecF